MKTIVKTAVLLFLAASTSLATVVVRVSFNEQARTADLVVMGKVVRIENIEIGGFPFSRAVVSIEETVAGDAPRSEIGVLQAGGKRRNGTQAIVGGTRYLKPGDEVFLMLRARPDGDYEIIGLNQGHYRIMVEKRTGRRVIELQEGGRKKYLTVDGAKRRIHAVRADSAGGKDGKR